MKKDVLQVNQDKKTTEPNHTGLNVFLLLSTMWSAIIAACQPTQANISGWDKGVMAAPPADGFSIQASLYEKGSESGKNFAVRASAYNPLAEPVIVVVSAAGCSAEVVVEPGKNELEEVESEPPCDPDESLADLYFATLVAQGVDLTVVNRKGVLQAVQFTSNDE